MVYVCKRLLAGPNLVNQTYIVLGDFSFDKGDVAKPPIQQCAFETYANGVAGNHA